MKILDFWAENFRTIEGRYQVPLTDDKINLITASNNGRGKSSLIFLYYFLVANHVVDTIEAYVNWNSKTMAGGITFEFTGKIFKIEYHYDNGKSEKTLDLDGEIFTGPSSVNKTLKEYFDPSIFINATALFQGNKNFVSVKDSERRDNLKKVFNLEYTQEIKDLEKEEKELQEKELAPKEKELVICSAKTFPTKEPIEQTIDLTTYEEAGNNLLLNAKEEFELKTKIDSVEKIKAEKKLLESKIVIEQSNITTNETHLEANNKQLDSLKNYKQDSSILDGYKTKLSEITLERLRAFDETELNSTRQNLADAQASLKVYQKQLSDCKSGKCPTCAKDFESSDIKSTEEKINSFLATIKNLTADLARYSAEQTEYLEKVRLNESKKRDKELLESKIEAEEKRLVVETEVNKKSIEQKMIDIEKRQESIKICEATLQELKDKLSLIEIPDVSSINDKLGELKLSSDELIILIKNYERIETENSTILKTNEENLKLEKENKKTLLKTQEEIDLLLEKKAQLTKMRFFLKNEFPSYVISSMIEQIQDDMNEFINKAYYKSLDVEIAGSDDKISVMYGTGDRKVDCINASGAEEALLSLAYCYSLNKLKHYDILMLDEVDQSMTEDNANKLAEIVITIQDDYDFLGVVSHVNSVKDMYATAGANIIEVDKDV